MYTPYGHSGGHFSMETIMVAQGKYFILWAMAWTNNWSGYNVFSLSYILEQMLIHIMCFTGKGIGLVIVCSYFWCVALAKDRQ